MYRRRRVEQKSTFILLFATALCLVMEQAAWAQVEEASADAECTSYIPPELSEDPNELALRGVACFESAEYLQALIFYREAYALSKSAPLRGAIGRALQELGYPDLAREYYAEYLKLQSPDTPGYQKIRQRMSIVEKRLREEAVEVELQTQPGSADAYVVLEDEYWEKIGKTPARVRLLPGDYRIVYRDDDYITQEELISVPSSDQPQTYRATLVPQESLFHSTGNSLRRWGVYTMIGAIPFAVAGGTFFVLSGQRSGEADDYQNEPNFDPARRDELRDESESFQTWGTASMAVGAGLLLTGGVLYLIGVSSRPDVESGTSLYLQPGEFGVRGSF